MANDMNLYTPIQHTAEMVQATKQIAQVQRVIEDSIPRMEESVFRQYYLPLFLSKVEVDLTPWLEVVGNPTQCAIILRNGVEAYRIPPLANTKGLTFVRRNRQNSLSYAIDQTQKQTDRLPPKEAEFVNKFITPLLPHAKVDTHIADMWNIVLKENGCPLLSETTVTTTAEKKSDDPESYIDGYDLA